MPGTKKLFISAVTSEFQDCRELLSFPDCIQRDFHSDTHLPS